MPHEPQPAEREEVTVDMIVTAGDEGRPLPPFIEDIIAAYEAGHDVVDARGAIRRFLAKRDALLSKLPHRKFRTYENEHSRACYASCPACQYAALDRLAAKGKTDAT